MIIKVFDIYKYITQDIIYILCYYFNNVYITKPYTSRPLNSEKYLICINFKDTITENDISSMKYIVENMKETMYNRLIKNEIGDEFMKCIRAINTAYGFRQVRYMNKVFNIINKNVMYKEITLLQKERLVYAYAWCIKYKFGIRKRCNLLRSKNF